MHVFSAIVKIIKFNVKFTNFYIDKWKEFKMKRTNLAVLMCLTTLNVYADDESHFSAPSQVNVTSESYASAHSSVSNNVSNKNSNSLFVTSPQTNSQTSSLNFNSPREASSAISPDVASYVKCPIITQDSKALSFFFASASGTTGTSVNGICYALERGDFETADKMMCKLDKVYAESNSKCVAK